MTYTSKLVEGNRYEIETEFNGSPISFHVVVAESESEIEELVQFHLNALANPIAPEVQSPAPDLTALVKEQQALITDMVAKLKAAGVTGF